MLHRAWEQLCPAFLQLTKLLPKISWAWRLISYWLIFTTWKACCACDGFSYSKIFARQMSHLMEVPRGSPWHEVGGWATVSYGLKGNLSSEVYSSKGTLEPVPQLLLTQTKIPDRNTRHLPQKTNKGTRTTAARKYSPGSFCITTTLALQTLWHTWHHVPPHPHHSLKSIRTSLICRR